MEFQYWMPPSTISRCVDSRLKKYERQLPEVHPAVRTSFQYRTYRVCRDTAELVNDAQDSYMVGFAVYLGIPLIRVVFV